MPDIRLDGKIALVTGATGGWGSGAATALAERGATVVCNSRSPSKLDVLADRLRARGGDVVTVAADVSTFAGAARAVAETVDRCGRIDILVSATAVAIVEMRSSSDDAASRPFLGSSLLEMSVETWDQVIGLELTGVFACTKLAATHMVSQGGGGSIIALAGGAGIFGMPGNSARAAAKGGVVSAVLSWSDELAPHGVRVNAIRGWVRSAITDPTWSLVGTEASSDPERGFDTASAAPLVVWLASDDARDVSGGYIGIDGARATIWEPRLPDTAVFSQPGWTPETLGARLGPILRRRPPRVRLSALTQGLRASLRDS